MRRRGPSLDCSVTTDTSSVLATSTDSRWSAIAPDAAEGAGESASVSERGHAVGESPEPTAAAAALQTSVTTERLSPLAASIDGRWGGADEGSVTLTIAPDAAEGAGKSASVSEQHPVGESALTLQQRPPEHGGAQSDEARETHPHAERVAPREWAAQRVEFEVEVAPMRADVSVPVRRYRGDTVVERPLLRPT